MQNSFEKKKMINYFKMNNLSLNKIINSLFVPNIKRITYLGSIKLKKLPEYNFRLLKFNVILENFCNYIVYVKLINNYQVEESLFCYWLFCEENHILYTKSHNSKVNIINCNSKYYEKKYELQLLASDNKIWKNSHIDIIDLNKYSNNKINKNLFIAIL